MSLGESSKTTSSNSVFERRMAQKVWDWIYCRHLLVSLILSFCGLLPLFGHIYVLSYYLLKSIFLFDSWLKALILTPLLLWDGIAHLASFVVVLLMEFLWLFLWPMFREIDELWFTLLSLFPFCLGGLPFFQSAIFFCSP